MVPVWLSQGDGKMVKIWVKCCGRVGFAVLLSLAAIPSSWAALVTSQEAQFFLGLPVVDIDPPAGPTTLPLSTTRSLPRFDSDLGVLLGVTLGVDSRMTGLLALDGSAGTESAAAVGVTTGLAAAPGAVLPVAPLVAQASCTSLGPFPLGCSSVGLSVGDVQGKAEVLPAPGVLDLYVGRTGKVDTTVSGGAQVNATEDGFGVATALWDSTWTGDISLDYRYALHAAPELFASSSGSSSSDSVLRFDFGTYYQTKDRTEGFYFGILNDWGDRVALDLDTVATTGNAGMLVAELYGGGNTFTDLAPGGVDYGSAYMDLSNPGIFSATYTYVLSDADVGAPTSRHNYTLTLELTGQVLPVSEPSALALVGLGLAAITAMRRSRRSRTAHSCVVHAA